MPKIWSFFASLAFFAGLFLPPSLIAHTVAQENGLGPLEQDSQSVGSSIRRPRQVSDLDDDLIRSLVRARRLDDAEWICRSEMQQRSAGQFGHAIWAARLGMVLAELESQQLFRNGGARETELGSQAATGATRASQHIENVLNSYPDAPASHFLRAANLQIRQQLLRSAILAASVSALDEPSITKLLGEIASLQGDTQRLSDVVNQLMLEQRIKLVQSDNSTPFERLIAELALQRVSLAVLQTELFEPESTDYVAASADAATLAENVMDSLPDRTASKRAARLMLAESMLRSGDHRNAGQLIRETLETLGRLPSAWLAVEVRRQLTLGELSRATQLAQSFYEAKSPTISSPQSPEMDDAWLRILLSKSDDSQSVARWFETVENRGGAFARRRAESTALSYMRSGTDQQAGTTGRPPRGTMNPAMNPAMVAAQGADWLRRGDAGRAARLMLAAALAEPNYKMAADYAAKAAAAFLSISDTKPAIQSMQAVANRFPNEPEACKLMLQAAMMAADKNFIAAQPSESLELLETLLGQASAGWPKTESGTKAALWRCDIFTKTERPREAAYASLEHFRLNATNQTLQLALTHWFTWLKNLDQVAVDEELTSLTLSLQNTATENSNVRPAISMASWWLFDRERLTTLQADRQNNATDNNDKDQQFILRLGRARTSDGIELPGDGVSTETVQRARWRLTRDGFKNPEAQPAVGRILLSLPNASEWEKAGAAVWAETSNQSIESITKLASMRNGSVTDLEKGIRWLTSTRSNEAKLAAVSLADQLSSLIPQRSEQWYRAKLQSIGWLSQLGKDSEAQKRAKYVLLIAPPTDPDLMNQFKQYAL